MTFTNDPIASSILTDLAHAKAVGFSTSNISGIFDLGPDQPTAHPGGQGEALLMTQLAPSAPPRSDGNAPALDLARVSKRYGGAEGVVALQDVTLEVGRASSSAWSAPPAAGRPPC